MKIINSILTGLVLVPSIVLSASNNPTYEPNLVADGNEWLGKVYHDNSVNHEPFVMSYDPGFEGVLICFDYLGPSLAPPNAPPNFKSTQDLYYWEIPNGRDDYGLWSGYATQEGDQVFLHGYNDVSFDSAQFELATKNAAQQDRGIGHWQAVFYTFPLNPAQYFSLNLELVRTGSSCQVSEEGRNVAVQRLQATHERALNNNKFDGRLILQDLWRSRGKYK